MKDFEYVCPSGDFTCPYWSQGFCTIGDPKEDCDDYAALAFWEDWDDDDKDRESFIEDFSQRKGFV